MHPLHFCSAILFQPETDYLQLGWIIALGNLLRNNEIAFRVGPHDILSSDQYYATAYSSTYIRLY